MDLVVVIGSLTEYMEQIIIGIAAAEILLFIAIRFKCNSQHGALLDIYRNVVKGLADVPDSLHRQGTHDQCAALLAYIDRKISSSSQEVSGIKRNVAIQLEKNTISNTYSIESTFSVGSALVQIFPLLGILGTILSLGQLNFTGGEVAASDVTSAFVIAIDTTILGMFFAIVFMLWESKLAVKVKNVIEDTNKTNTLFSQVML